MTVPIRLSLIWLFVLGGLGFFFPFYSLYLSENAALSGTQVGAVMAIPPLVGILVQPFWGQLADRRGSRVGLLVGLAAASAAGYALLVLPRGFAGFALGTLGLAIFAVALVPSLVAATFALLQRSDSHAFGRVRVWGTVGFGISVAGFPFLLDGLANFEGLPHLGASTEPLLWTLFPLAALSVGSAAWLARGLPRGGAEGLRAMRGDWHGLMRHGPFLRILLFTFGYFLFSTGPIALFPILVSAQGGGVDAISRMWLLMLALELPLVALLGASVARLGLRTVIALGALGSGVRWLVSGTVDDLFWVSAAQLLHGVSVWGVILGVPLLVDRVAPERLRSTGQALVAMIGFNLGGGLSNLLAGWLIDARGATAPALYGGLAVLALTAFSPLLLPRDAARVQPVPEEAGDHERVVDDAPSQQ